MLILRFVVGILLSGFFILGGGVASSQDYPNKPIRIVTTAAGGGSDFDARQIAQGITGPLGQPVVVDNRANTNVASEIVSKSPPDGYTLLLTGAGLWTMPLLQKTPYDLAELAPVGLIESTINMVAVNPAVPAKSINELITLAKSKPGQLNYASVGVGSRSHLGAELLKSMTGVNLLHVPYKGNANAISALISGEVQVMFLDIGLLEPQVKSGKLRALAVTSAKPTPLAPGVPTVAASIPGYESAGMTGIWVRTKTPATIINRLNQEIVRFLSRPDVKERFLNAGIEVTTSSPEELGSMAKAEVARISKVIKDANIKAD